MISLKTCGSKLVSQKMRQQYRNAGNGIPVKNKIEYSKRDTEGLLIIYRNLDPVLMLRGREFVKRDIRRQI